jgi:hypothetical protein
MEKNKNSLIMRVCVIVIIAVFLISIVSLSGGGNPLSSKPLSISDLGYSSAYEGPKAQFLGVTYNGLQYTASNTHGASEHQFDTVMHFDPDDISGGKPKIQGEMTAIFLPSETLSSAPSWIPMSWLLSNGYVSNPMTGANGVNPPYSWNISGNTYLMEEYHMRYYVSFSAEWNGKASGTDSPFGNPGPGIHGEMPSLTGAEAVQGITKTNVYLNTGVWIKFNITPTWYIAGGGNAYFAIAEVNMATSAQLQGQDANGATYDARTTESVSPESQNSLLYLYYSAFGAASQTSNIAYQYNGKDLNPAYFTNALYAHIDLNNFGVSTQPVNLFGSLDKGDTATFAFDIKVFVIGEYKVQDIQNTPDQYGRYTPIDTTGNNWLTGIVGWLSSPANVALLMVILVIAAIVIFAPWLLVVIVSIFRGGKK